MHQSTLRSALALLLAIVASSSRADETTATALPHLDPVQLTYRAYDPQRTLINEATLLAGVNQAMTSLTKWPIKTVHDTQDAVLDTGGRTQLDTSRHVLVVQYVAHSRYLSGGYTGTTLSIPVTYALERTDEAVKITLTFPEQGTVLRHGMPFLTRKLWDMNGILGDYSSIATRVQAVELLLNYQARGELESKLKPDAVLGNLERLLTRPARGSMPLTNVGGAGAVSRDESFVCTVDGNRREVQVSTFPYHDGTKVSYSAVLPYRLKPDSTVDGDEEALALKSLLSKVIDD